MNLGEDLVMNKAFKFAAVSALALIVASPAVAQSAVTGITGLNERIDDIESDVRTDLARGEDTQRFGPLGVPQDGAARWLCRLRQQVATPIPMNCRSVRV